MNFNSPSRYTEEVRVSLRRLLLPRQSLLAIGLGLSMSLGACLAALDPIPPLPERKRTALQTTLTNVFTRIGAPGMVVGLWIPDEGSFVTTVGTTDIATGRPLIGIEHFRIGSITKTFTVTAILQLADEGRLSLDDPVGQYLSFVPDGDRITLRMLSNMTSGLTSYSADDDWVKEMLTYPDRAYTPGELVEVALRHPADAPPGEKWAYINTNTVLLGLVVERVTGRPVQEFFQRRIFQPLGLTHTFWPTNAFLPDPYAHGVTRQTLDNSKVDATHWNPSWAYAAGQLVSNLDDLRVWAKACAKGTLVSPRMQRERLQWSKLPPNTDTRKYGLGIGSNAGWLGHTGELPGYNVSAFYLPAKDATLVVLINSDIPTQGVSPAAAVLKAVTAIITPGNVLTEK